MTFTISEYRRLLDLPYDPSRFQVAIYDWILNGSGHGVVEAVAGSGKTETLVGCAKLIDKGLFVAFNKHIADELSRRLTGSEMIAKTVHSVGFGVVGEYLGGRIKVDGKKYHWSITDYLTATFGIDSRSEELTDMRRVLRKVVDLVRLNMIDPSDIEAVTRLAIHHDIKLNGLARHVAPIIQDGNERARSRRRIIDFTDMLYLPLVWNLKIPQSPWVFVDECQDLNRAQLEFVLRCCEVGGRMLFVGDRAQAIYGFAGADADSFLNIIRVTSATLLPLSICYRCPSSVVDLARQYVPDMLARSDAPTGSVNHVKRSELNGDIVPGDLVLCRVNAPLVSFCIELISQGKNARVKGRDIGRMLCETLEMIERIPGFDFSRVMHYLKAWQEIQYQYLDDKEADRGAYERVDDTLSALSVCIESYPSDTMSGLCDRILGLFSDDKPAIWLSSIHKAKGLENKRVFVLRPDKLPLYWVGQQEWEAQQESNLCYVAITRSQSDLIFIQE